MNKDMYKNVAENLLKVLPKNWEKVYLYSQITESSYEFFFYVKINGVFVQCFELEKDYGISKKHLRDVFKSLNIIIRPDYEEKKWFVMSYFLTNTGKFDVDYEYEDYSEKTFEYKQHWIKKYIK